MVAGLVSYSLRRFRERPGGPPARPIYGNPKLEIGYPVAIVIFGGISYVSVLAMHASDPPFSGGNSMLIVAHQSWWAVHYPQSGIVTANEIHVPVDQQIRIGLKSATSYTITGYRNLDAKWIYDP